MLTRNQCCCDMRGLLAFQVLWLLSKKRMYGDEIAAELSKRRGEKPNPGTLYPVISDLEERGLIKTKKEGNKRICYITRQGMSGFSVARDYFCNCFGEIFQEAGSLGKSS